MAIRTVHQNDASSYSFFSTSSIMDKISLIYNDLRELKNNGGNILLPIVVQNSLEPHGDNYTKNSLFPNPAHLAIYQYSILQKKDADLFKQQKNEFRQLIKDLLILQYDDISKLFNFKIENHIVEFEYELSGHEIGAICSLFPKECAKFLQELTEATKDYHFNKPVNFSINDQSNLKGKKRYSVDENGNPNFLRLNSFESDYRTSDKFAFSNTDLTKNSSYVSSLAGFTFLHKARFLDLDHYNDLYSDSKELFSYWLSGQENLIQSIIETFDEEQKSSFEHFLFESLSSNIKKHFLYTLEKNNVLKVPKYKNITDVFNSLPKDEQQSNINSLKYLTSNENEEYMLYLNKLKLAINDKNYDFLDKNMPNFNVEDYKQFVIDLPEKSKFSLFDENITLETIKYLEKYNLFPAYNFQGNDFFLLPFDITKSPVTQSYLEYKPEFQTKENLSTILKIFINEQYGIANITPDIDALQFFKDSFAPFFKVFDEMVLPKIKDGTFSENTFSFNFLSYVYRINDKNLVSNFFSVLNEHFTENQMYKAIGSFFPKFSDNPKLLTGVKDFSKKNKFNLSDNRLAATYYNSLSSYTNSFISKIKDNFSFDFNAPLGNSVVWWDIGDYKLYIGNGQNDANFNIKNIQGKNITDIFLEQAIKNRMKINKNDFENLDTVNKHQIINNLKKINSIAEKFETHSKDNPNNQLEINNLSTYNGISDLTNFINISMDNYFNSNIELFRQFTDKQKNLSTINIGAALYGVFQSNNIAHSIFDNYQNIQPNPLSKPFLFIIRNTSWDTVLPKMFQQLNTKEDKDNLFKNLTIAFSIADSLNFTENSITKWEALFANHDNYDIEFEINSSSLIENNLKLETITNIINDAKNNTNISNFHSDLKLNGFQLELFLNTFSKGGDIDFNYEQLSSKIVLFNYKLKTNIANIIDALTLQHRGEETNIISVNKKAKEPISHLFNKYIYAQELGSKLQDKEAKVENKRKL